MRDIVPGILNKIYKKTAPECIAIRTLFIWEEEPFSFRINLFFLSQKDDISVNSAADSAFIFSGDKRQFFLFDKEESLLLFRLANI